MSQKLPKFSVVTVSYNQGEFIRDTIESVLNQNYPEFEHIVIDGGSTDNTIEVLKEYSHLNWVSEPDNGQTDALNKGFSKATGDIIAWINSDDWYAPNIFHTVAKHLESSFLTFGASEVVDRDGNTKAKIRNTERTWLDLMKYWCSYAIPAQPSVFFRRELLEEFKRSDGTYLDESLHYCMDFDFWLRITTKYPFDNRI
ncbi:MAG: glycosyltransferase, partial [Bdellovibrionales bacterium]|nr:glycosyltransferase [Bdellovibrionales bacterium]